MPNENEHKQWQAPWTPATAMPDDEMEDRRSGLQVYLSSLSKLTESWQSDIVTRVLCAEEDEASAVGSPVTDQVSLSDGGSVIWSASV